MITHDLDSIFRTCNRVGVIVDQRMESDTLERIVDHPQPVDPGVLPRRAGARPHRSGAWNVTPTTPPSAPSCCSWRCSAALFVYWYSDTREHRDYNRYEIYFDGSVSGLDKGAAVRYLGVGVGRVSDMRIDPRDSSRVEVIVDIDSTHADLGQHGGGAAAAGGDGSAVHRPERGPHQQARGAGGQRAQVPGDPLGALALRRVPVQPAGARRHCRPRW